MRDVLHEIHMTQYLLTNVVLFAVLLNKLQKLTLGPSIQKE